MYNHNYCNKARIRTKIENIYSIEMKIMDVITQNMEKCNYI